MEMDVLEVKTPGELVIWLANVLFAFENLQKTGEKKHLVGEEQDKELLFTMAVTPFEKENSSIRGLSRIYLDKCFVINSVSFMMGKNVMFVSMPSYKTKQVDENNKSVHKDICYPITVDFREKLNTLLTDAYEREAAEMQENIVGQTEGLVPAQDFSEMDLPTR